MISEMTLGQLWVMFIVPFSLGMWTVGNIHLWIWTIKKPAKDILFQMLSTVGNLGGIFAYILYIAGTL
jgi:hypothetical protein